MNADKLTMAFVGHDGLPLAAGDRVELHPGLDLWMRGTRFGRIFEIYPDGIARVVMDSPQITRVQKIPVNRLKGVS